MSKVPSVPKVPPIARSAEELLAQLENLMEERAVETLRFREAQPERQERFKIRGGGAPASKAEALAMLDTLRAAQGKVRAAAAGMTKAEAQELLATARGALKALSDAFPGAHVAILFRSGGPFIYPNSVIGDYTKLQVAGSKGKAVWAMGWGPNRSPSYFLWSYDPTRVIEEQPVTSSWLLRIYLVNDAPVA